MVEINLTPFKFEHIEQLGDTAGVMLIPPTTAVQLERQPSLTALTPDGRVIGCAGVVKIWRRRWQAWAHVNPVLAKEYLYQVVKSVRGFLADLGEGRVEAAIAFGEHKHVRFANACGFDRLEAEYMERYLPDGRAASLWVRIV